MRKLNGVFLIGLCIGAVGAIAVSAQHVPARPEPAAASALQTRTPTSSPPSTSATPTPTPTPTPAKASDPAPKTVDAATLDALVPGGKVSAVVYDRTTGETLLSAHADRAFPTESVVKLLIALEVLDHEGPAEQVQRMLMRSDDALASTFWGTYGGPGIVERWAAAIGLRATRPPQDPGRWGDTQTTASDVVKIYRYLLDRAPAGVRKTIMTALRVATERGSDGYRQFFGIPDGLDSIPWAIKQGWACCIPNATRTLHTTGVVGPGDRYVVVVLTSRPSSVGDAAGGRQVTSVVSALRSLLG